MRIVEHCPFWRVYDYWCFGNESELIAKFETKLEAEEYIRRHGTFFDGCEGMGVCEPYDMVEKEDGNIVFYFV